MTEMTVSPSRKRGVRLSKQTKTDIAGYIFCAPWILSILVFTAYPTLASFYFSFHKYNIIQPPRYLGLTNYVNMFTKDPRLMKSIYNSAYYTLLSVPLGMTSSLVLAVLLASRVRLIGFFRTLYYMPSLVPAVAGTLLWMLMMDPRQGLINAALTSVGLPRLGWFADPNWSKPALLLMSLWGVGAGTLIFLASLKDVPMELLEAATIDGANGWRRFWGVVIPLISPVILFNLVMSLLGSFQVFTAAFVAGSGSGGNLSGGPTGTAGGPLDSMLMYMVYLYTQAFRYFEMGYASAMAVVLFLVIMSLTLLIFRSSGGWVHYEGGVR
ncbi:MAG: carbohydrate ABC transporter permease [Anaerolineae bacterium]